jgi:hypothetical protein
MSVGVVTRHSRHSRHSRLGGTDPPRSHFPHLDIVNSTLPLHLTMSTEEMDRLHALKLPQLRARAKEVSSARARELTASSNSRTCQSFPSRIDKEDPRSLPAFPRYIKPLASVEEDDRRSARLERSNRSHRSCAPPPNGRI